MGRGMKNRRLHQNWQNEEEQIREPLSHKYTKHETQKSRINCLLMIKNDE